ncbi:MAG: cysteine--tRNA ligase [bacterium]|nr:cysteine--tRNA ligase [bacterium]
MLKLYNTLSRQKEIFKPLKDKKVGMYTCGPTVYWYAHIGNFRSYILPDIFKRVLIFNGYKVNHVMNYTDVGHLTSDADTGEDKMEKGARREGKTVWEIADFYKKAFEKDAVALNILKPNKTPRATDHIKEQIELIKILEKKGYTYKIKDGIYFDTVKLKDYGKLANLNIEKLKAGARVEVVEGKKNPTDFVLWPFSPQDSKRQMEWNSPWGIGFPGWHIECSAMSSKYLGKQFDIHTGGEDLISVHHTNEIAQSEAAFGKKPWVKYWLHGAFLTFKGEKVSKSKGGLTTISELEKIGFSPLDYRYLCLTAHYRKPLDFSLEGLANARNSLQRLKNIISEIKDDKKTNKQYLKKFENAINDDLDMPKAVSVLWELIRDKKAIGKIKTIEKIDSIFGLDLLKKEKLETPATIKKLLEQREIEKNKKNWEEADKIREEIKKMGYQVEDTDKGPKIKKINK